MLMEEDQSVEHFGGEMLEPVWGRILVLVKGKSMCPTKFKFFHVVVAGGMGTHSYKVLYCRTHVLIHAELLYALN